MNRKFSVVIPTMLKCVDITNKLLTTLYDDPAVSEVIVIDNSYEDNKPNKPSELVTDDKLNLVVPGYNLFVNPSWNLGVSLAKEEYIGILNDDITIPENVFSGISSINIEDMGVFGASHPHIIQTEAPQRFTVEQIHIQHTSIRNWGFGIFMIMHKSRYVEIPDFIKIWCGDDLIFHTHMNGNRYNVNLLFPIMTKMSATSDLPEFDAIKQNDLLLFEKYKKQHNL